MDGLRTAGCVILLIAVALGSSGPASSKPLDTLTIAAPADMTATATTPCGQAYCAQVDYSFTVSGGYPPYNLVCNLPSGGLFTVGTHQVSCLAQDSKGDSTPQASFNLTVNAGSDETTPPPSSPPPATLSISPPGDMTATATTPCGQTYCAQVDYSFTVSGGYPPYNLVCNLPSGNLFTVGSHQVSCLAQDSRGDSTPQASFNLTVNPVGTSTSSGNAGGSTAGAGTSGGDKTGAGGSGTASTGGGGGGASSSKDSSPSNDHAATAGTPSLSAGDPSSQQPVSSKTFAIEVPATITVTPTKRILTVKTENKSASQTLCWHTVSSTSTAQTCAKGHGTWQIKLKKESSREMLVLKVAGKVVSKKTVNIKLTS